MNILFVTSTPLEINASSSLRNRATIKGLIHNGHEVSLITTKPDRNHENYEESLGMIEGLNKEYVELKSNHESTAKLLRKFKFLEPIKLWAFKQINKRNIYDSKKEMVNYIDELNIIEQDYDLVISSSDPKSSHLFVYELFNQKVFKNIPWLQIWGDPFANDITSHISEDRKEKVSTEEYKLLSSATKIMYVSKFTLEDQQELYHELSNKMFHQPVPYEAPTIYKRENQNEKKIFLYAGDYFSNVRNIIPLYEAFQNSKHQLIICGSSDLNLIETNNIKIYPRLPQSHVNKLISKTDVLIHLSNLKGKQIPGKIYNYSGTNLPILYIRDGLNVIHDYFNSFNRFIFSNNNPKDISRKIENLVEDSNKALNQPLEEFSASKVSKQIIKEVFQSMDANE